jgi:hypothetical protein
VLSENISNVRSFSGGRLNRIRALKFPKTKNNRQIHIGISALLIAYKK